MDQLNSTFLRQCLPPHLSIRTWLSYVQRGGGPRRDISIAWIFILLRPFSYLRAIQGHSGGEQINPKLQDDVLLPSDFVEYIYHVGSFHDMHSIIQSGLIPGGKDIKKRETDGILHSRESSVHSCTHAKGLRRDEAQNCSVQTK